MREIVLHKLCAGYGKKTVLRDISFSVKEGEILTLLGANGEGKTTLLKTICRLIPSQGGRVEAAGRDLLHASRRETARLLAYVPQNHVAGIAFTVRDMAVLGRVGKGGVFSGPGKGDYEKADAALELLGLSSLAHKSYLHLSGGEQRLVLIARALAQEARFIFLDEPVSNLDLGNQAKVLRVVHRLAREGIGILMTSHFPDHSLWLEAHTAILQEGRLTDFGRAEEIITGERLTRLYGTPIEVVRHGDSRYCEPRFVKEIKDDFTAL
ncbi:MAG: ABC transporter ATP-binding protein [Spirochaetales bacterium]|nr:ABC transporter ATP-binding protein [Spirochaetales bacterium]